MIKSLLILILTINLFSNEIDDLRKDFFYNVVLKQLLKNKQQNKLKIAVKVRKIQTTLSIEDIKRYKKIIINSIGKNNISSMEYFSIVNLQKQIFTILLYSKDDDKLYLIGSDLISSGNKNREEEIKYGEDHYFDTPVGVFNVKKGWRSTGSFKDKNKTIQSYGSKGRYVYHFGNMLESRYHSFTKNRSKIKNKKDYIIIKDQLNFAIHSYNLKDPTYKLGYKASHGCVRMSDELNLYLENNLVLLKNFYKNNKWKSHYSKEPNNIKYKKYKGSYLIIIDK